jgi:hypothetical protein
MLFIEITCQDTVSIQQTADKNFDAKTSYLRHSRGTQEEAAFGAHKFPTCHISLKRSSFKDLPFAHVWPD